MCFGKFKVAFTITVREIIPVVYRCSRSENPMYGVFFITNPSHEIFPASIIRPDLTEYHCISLIISAPFYFLTLLDNDSVFIT